MATTVDPAAEWWTTTEVATYLGLKLGTVSSYRQRGQMPAPDQTLGRTHLWRPKTIVDWHEHRPRVASDLGDVKSKPDPASKMASHWVSHDERTLYDSEWVRLSLVDVELPDGERFEHHVVTLAPTAIIAVLDDTGENVLMMWRHRFASDIWNWELPGGIVEHGEDPAVAAAREAEEETGYRPTRVEHLVTYEPIIGMVRCPHHIFASRGAKYIGAPTETTEMDRLEWVRMASIPDLIARGLIRASGTLVGLLSLLAGAADQ